ncbi:DUF1206 domain-containing protein [Aphanothece hegewaldii]|uniref:DUF1206 domain-containing protein n=1 Tax=Aphanothece hegewaldii TaxID=1521625 RepID=UPI001FEA8F6E|nr:DUF1206 domain-containing protein [Aphanothece hegewaldii]
MVYFIIGLLAAQAAFGVGGKTTDSKGALQMIVTQPFGKFLLSLVTVGLIGYALWRTVETFLDPEHPHQHRGAKQIARRLGYAISALSYFVLAATAIKLILGSGGGSNNSTQDWTARFLSQPFGQWLVGLAGMLVIGLGFYELYKAYKGKFRKHLQLSMISPQQRTWAIILGQIGIAARGIVFATIGVFLTQAALTFDPNRAKGLGEALAALAAQPFGRWILGGVALGLIAYSIYSLIEARYRQLPKINNHR